MKYGGLLNRENVSGVNALFRWSCLRPYHIDIINVGGLQLIWANAKFHSLSNDVKNDVSSEKLAR